MGKSGEAKRTEEEAASVKSGLVRYLYSERRSATHSEGVRDESGTYTGVRSSHSAPKETDREEKVLRSEALEAQGRRDLEEGEGDGVDGAV